MVGKKQDYSFTDKKRTGRKPGKGECFYPYQKSFTSQFHLSILYL